MDEIVFYHTHKGPILLNIKFLHRYDGKISVRINLPLFPTEFHDFYPSPLVTGGHISETRPPPPSVTYILQFYT